MFFADRRVRVRESSDEIYSPTRNILCIIVCAQKRETDSRERNSIQGESQRVGADETGGSTDDRIREKQRERKREGVAPRRLPGNTHTARVG